VSGDPTVTDGGDFDPPRWLRNPHLQSIVPACRCADRRSGSAARTLLEASVAEVIDCGDDVRLLAYRATQAALAGPRRAASSCCCMAGKAARTRSTCSRWAAAARPRLRRAEAQPAGHGDSHHLNPGIFHSCRIAEVVGAVQRLQALAPQQRLSLVGFSLGGNFCLRVAPSGRGGIRHRADRAVCPVLDPEHTLMQLERGFALYRRYFIWKWRRSLRRKQAAWPQLYDLAGRSRSTRSRR